jgi:hypothetical protein
MISSYTKVQAPTYSKIKTKAFWKAVGTKKI